MRRFTASTSCWRRQENDLVVMSDSDTRVTPHMLSTVAAEFQSSHLGIATCPYRAVPGASFWARLEAAGMNTDFMAGILVARMLEGMRFAVGPTIVARRRVLQAMGGVERLKDYLAEDFVLGKFAAEAGHGVILSSYVIEHHIGSADFRNNAAHRLRWARSTRRSRPFGYLGQLFTMPLPLALLVCAASAAWWPVLVGTFVVRMTAAYVVSARVLRARLNWLLLPLEDLVSFCIWIAGFFGSTITWRGRRYRLHSGRALRTADPWRQGREPIDLHRNNCASQVSRSRTANHSPPKFHAVFAVRNGESHAMRQRPNENSICLGHRDPTLHSVRRCRCLYLADQSSKQRWLCAPRRK